MIEYSNLVEKITLQIGSFLSKTSGGVLIVDYGEFRPGKNTLRAIKDHYLIDTLFNEIGQFDLTADVDFSMIARNINLQGTS